MAKLTKLTISKNRFRYPRRERIDTVRALRFIVARIRMIYRVREMHVRRGVLAAVRAGMR